MSTRSVVTLVAATLLVSAGWAHAQWTAYNDCVYSSSPYAQYTNTSLVTTYNIGSGSPGPTSGYLKNYATGNPLTVTATLTQSGSVIWQADQTTGGKDCNVGTDAYSVFGTIADMHGVIYYGSSGWYVDLQLSGLSPSKLYEFVTSANRGAEVDKGPSDADYANRFTRYTLSGADAFTNASSSGVTIANGGASTIFGTGYNTTNGYVARWININPGADGTITIRAEADNPAVQYKAYSFDVFKLVEVAPTGIALVTLDATGLQPNSATLNGQLTDIGGESQVQVYFQWGTAPSSLNQSTTPQTLTAPGTFSAPLTGLTPETAYYFKAVATAGSRTAEGAVLSFLYASNYGLQFNGTTSHVTMGPAPGLDSATFTIETWFKRTGPGQTTSSGTGGVTAVPLVCKGAAEGDGSNIDANYFLGIQSANNALAADFEDTASGLNHPVAGVTPIQDNVWYHAAATYDGTTWRLYLNGVLDAELIVNATPRFDSIQHFGLGTSMNSTGVPSGRLDGVLDEVRVWNYARSQDQIRAAVNTEVASAPGLLGRWGLNEGSGTVTADTSGHGWNGTLVNATWAVGSPFNLNLPPDSPILVQPPQNADVSTLTVPLTVHVSDFEADAMQVKFFGRKLHAVPPPPFSIVALPDTQNYSKTYPATFTAQTQWIKDNRQTLNIAYVGHEGDIVNDSDQSYQWDNANAALSILDTLPDLPYGLCIGNHDENPYSDPSGTATFASHFPSSRYQSRPWYGGYLGANNEDHYILFSAGGMDFIAIHLKFDPTGPAAALPWAGNLLATYSNRRGIVVAHSILETTAAWTTQGALIYNALKGYPNLFLMMCGHNHGEARRADVYNGHTVYSLLADFQEDPNGGNGWLRVLQFVPADNSINVTTYSPTLAQYETDDDSQFSLAYDMGGAGFAELGTLTGVASNTDATFTWANLEPRRTYQWYATVSDGRSLVTGPVWTFAIPVPPGPELTLSPTSFDRSFWIHSPVPNDVFTVTNTGQGTLDYTITDDAGWLSVAPASGSSTGEADPIQVIYDTTSLGVGTHTATITVAAPGAWNGSQTVSVAVHVSTVRPDFDGDGDVDQEDFGHLQACLTGTGIPLTDPTCGNADLDHDNDIDPVDLAIYLQCARGANNPVEPTCAD